MKRLYLMRHSKADHTKNVDDRDRKLSKSGVERCHNLSLVLKENNYIPEIIITSDAVRTKDTAKYIAKDLGIKDAPIKRPNLYLATPGEIITEINLVDDKYKSLLVSGHNPGLHQLVLLLSATDKKGLLINLAAEFPPAAFVAFDIDISSWSELEAGMGDLINYINVKS